MIQYRRSRLHDEKGNIAPLREIIRFPLIIFQAILKKLFKYYPKAPIIPFGARQALAQILNKNMHLVEFGSGQSTLWYANRCKEVITHETDKAWFEKVSKSLTDAGCENVEIIWWDGKSFTESIKSPPPDLIVVDGINRVICIEYAIEVAAAHTWIYLDNSDKDMDPPDPEREMRHCERLILDFAQSTGREYKYFTGFAPAQAFGEQGLLIYPSSKPASKTQT